MGSPKTLADKKGNKRCHKCRIDKPATSEFFFRDSSRWDGWNHQCKTCTSAKFKKYRSQNPDKIRSYALKAKYDLTIGEYERMVEAQGGCCAICRKVKKLFVDHCHETGKVRGLLCQKCNTALGFLFEDLESMQRMIEYVEGQNARIS